MNGKDMTSMWKQKKREVNKRGNYCFNFLMSIVNYS